MSVGVSELEGGPGMLMNLGVAIVNVLGVCVVSECKISRRRLLFD